MQDFIRSYLYAPGNRPDLMTKVFTAGADAVVIDLEDAVPPSEKAEARRLVCDALHHQPTLPVYVRINTCEAGLVDAAELPATISGIRVPKAEDPGTVRRLHAILDAAGSNAAGIELHPLIESAIGLFSVDDLAGASTRVTRFAFGAGDFVHDVRGDKTVSRSETLFARSFLVARSRYLDIAAPIAHVFSPVADLDNLAAASREDRALGFFGRSCIHPRQVGVINRAFDFSANEIERAAVIVKSYEAAVAQGRGTVMLDSGVFIDEAVAKRAKRILATVHSKAD